MLGSSEAYEPHNFHEPSLYTCPRRSGTSLRVPAGAWEALACGGYLLGDSRPSA